MIREVSRRFVRLAAELVQTLFYEEVFLPLGPVSVEQDGTISVSARSDRCFIPMRLVIPSTIATDFVIKDIKTGKRSLLASSGTLPASLFTEQSLGVQLLTSELARRDLLIVVVTNKSAFHRNFHGMVVGRSRRFG